MSSDQTAARLVLALRQSGITNGRMLEAIESVPRHAFAKPGFKALSAEDVHLPLPAGQTVAPPIVTAQILSPVTRSPGSLARERAFLIGAGGGYSAALLARLVGHVTAIDRSAELVAFARHNLSKTGIGNVDVLHADGLSAGALADTSPLIVVMGTLAVLPSEWLERSPGPHLIAAPIGTFEKAELQVWAPGEPVEVSPLASPLLPLRPGLSQA
ncbi:MAG: methyltransferase domain-containing protein [Pseudomonadota bacterium]